MKYFNILLAIILVSACSPQIQVYSDSDPGYAVQNLKYFDWSQKSDIEKSKNPLYYNELNDKRIKNAILEQLTMRGYTLSEVSPEMLIHYHIVVDDQSTIVRTEPYGYFYGPYWMRTRTDVYSYRKGSLIIDLMDAKTNNLIWRGWATTNLTSITPDEAEEIINLAIFKIFRRFPHSNKKQHQEVSIIRND
ncbi:DUF4136 domain-containing protein [Chryseotalea sanaruensis]|uniref:DUF4136 domain-containing protein n=1 Tax=Chryseotalea sanaruensis TaxID=2482724 RepID=A0A401U674_9BACT|nr:DUF4136 domain-containing protein [Chryseotalea sanaruensis]GCC50385.1 DUF4136 domain-containing protein [Chryseotalea sanaruensis]